MDEQRNRSGRLGNSSRIKKADQTPEVNQRTASERRSARTSSSEGSPRSVQQNRTASASASARRRASQTTTTSRAAARNTSARSSRFEETKNRRAKQSSAKSFLILGGMALVIVLLLLILFKLPNSTTPEGDETLIAAESSTEPSTAESVTQPTTPESTEETTTEETTPEETTTAPPFREPDTIHLIAVGDNLIHWTMQQSGFRPDGTYNYDHLYMNINHYIQAADIAMINQEVPLGGPELTLSTYPDFNVAFEIGDAVVNAGFDVATLATNHTLDREAQGVTNMITYLKEHFPNLLLTGAYLSQEERDTTPIYECKGVKIAFLNYTYGTNGHWVDIPYMVNYINRDQMAADIAKAREEADFVIVAPHWGTEYLMEVDSDQLELTDFFAEQGVDLVIGTHPHVPQKVVCRTNSLGKPMYVYYSLGNFISQQNTTEKMLGEVADITLAVDGYGNVTIQNAAVDFTITQYCYDPSVPCFTEMSTYHWSDYTPDLAAIHGVVCFDPTFSYDRLKTLTEQLSVIEYQ